MAEFLKARLSSEHLDLHISQMAVDEENRFAQGRLEPPES